jgi:hypothetical protein
MALKKPFHDLFRDLLGQSRPLYAPRTRQPPSRTNGPNRSAATPPFGHFPCPIAFGSLPKGGASLIHSGSAVEDRSPPQIHDSLTLASLPCLAPSNKSNRAVLSNRRKSSPSTVVVAA